MKSSNILILVCFVFIIGCEHSAHTFIIPHHIMIYIVEYLGEGVPVEAIGFDKNSPKFIKHWEQVQIKIEIALR